LWIALPVAVLVAAYAPGTAPFALGQAAFTVTVIVLFNLLVPTGWRVGLVRIQDVLIGCVVSLVVGVLFWPRGASAAVGDDLADAFRRGAAYLTQAVDWSLGLRQEAPDTAVAAVAAAIRLDDALRLFLTEQGTKRASKHDLWSLVMATIRLRLTANSLAGLRAHCPPLGTDGHPDPVHALRRLAADLAEFYRRIAVQLGPPGHDQPTPLAIPALSGVIDGPDGAGGADDAGGADHAGGADDAGGADHAGGAGGAGGADRAGGAGGSEAALVRHRPHEIWVREHLRELGSHAHDIIAPAEHVAQLRRVPWWR